MTDAPPNSSGQERETRRSVFRLYEFTVSLSTSDGYEYESKPGRYSPSVPFASSKTRKKYASVRVVRYWLRLLSWRMTLAKEMLVTHSSSFLMFLGRTVWHRCLGSMVRFTSGILLLSRLYLQRGKGKIRILKWSARIIVLIRLTMPPREISSFIRMKLCSQVDLRCFCCLIGWPQR